MKPIKAWLQEYHGYKTKICKLERELQYSFDDIELQEFCQIVTTLKKKIVRLKELSTNTDVKYIDRIKVLMEQIELEILQIKKKNREEYESLNMEEKNLTREIDSMREVIESWTRVIQPQPPQPISTPSHYISSPVKSHTNNAIPVEVIEYEDFLKKNGGITGGWDQQDHTLFLKMYTKYKNNDQMIITQLLKLVPHCNIFSIQEHLQFFKSLQEYTLKRKNAIQNWKKGKQTERDEMVTQFKEEDQVLQMRVEEKIKQDLIVKEKEQRKRELEEWKQQKLKEREEKKRQEEEKNKLKKKEESKEMQSKKEQIKIKLEEYKQRKLLQQHSSSEEEEEQTPSLTAEQMERIRLKNVEYLHRRKLLKELKEPKEKSMIIVTPTVVAERDFSRLIAPTESHSAKLIEKAVEKTNPNKSQQSLFILTTQHRSIPSWRK